MNHLIEGRVWVVGDSVNTDAMYPAHAMKLPLAEAARLVFYDLRPGWADQVRPGDVLVAGRNFGIGSSRPVAALFCQRVWLRWSDGSGGFRDDPVCVT